MSTTNLVFVDKLGGTPASQYIGRENELFYSAADGFLRLSDGVTPGGILLNMIGRQGYCGSFYDTTTQTNLTQINKIKLNTTTISDGITIVDQSKITFLHTGRYNIQFSLQIEKSDAGSDDVDLFLMRDGSIEPWSNTKVTLVGNNAKYAAAWNFVTEQTANSYVELAWYSADSNLYMHAESSFTNPTRPAIPSAIVTVCQV